MKTILMSLLVCCSVPIQLFAQPPTDRTQQLVKELKTLTNQAERNRAADRRFIDQLRDLTNRYDRPWGNRLIFDNFKDGELQRNPLWFSNSRNFWVTPSIGLRTQVQLAQIDRMVDKPSTEQLLLGMLLDGTMKNKQANPTAAATRADLSTQADIPNAFAITIHISSLGRDQRGDFEWGVYQGQNMESGYRLSYQGGSKPSLKLLAYHRGATTIIDQFNRDRLLEDGHTHKITWQRTANGLMRVMVNGQRLMQVRDQSYRDHFSGLVMTNRGGDFAIRSISVSGTN